MINARKWFSVDTRLYCDIFSQPTASYKTKKPSKYFFTSNVNLQPTRFINTMKIIKYSHVCRYFSVQSEKYEKKN